VDIAHAADQQSWVYEEFGAPAGTPLHRQRPASQAWRQKASLAASFVGENSEGFRRAFNTYQTRRRDKGH
jgi:hypothetical protein